MSTQNQPSGNGDTPAPGNGKSNSDHYILVADDEAVMRQFNTRALVCSGYQVDTAVDGDAAWKALQVVSYGLLITDNQMPKVTGVELLKKCRDERMTLPIILATGTPPVAAESLRFAAILVKPFTLEELLGTVKAALQGQMPTNTTPTLRRCARRLLVYEAGSPKTAGAKGSAAGRVFEQLREPLINLMGMDGYCSLFSRVLTLAGAEIPWVRGLETTADGSLQGLQELTAKLDSSAIAAGGELLTTQLLGLLVTLIGSAVTQRLLQSIWPKMDGLDL